jgi:hypothetical protein
VRPVYETSTQYFSCSCGNGTDSRKSAAGHITPNFFLHPLGSVGHVEPCGASGARNIDALFFLLGWHLYRFHKKHVGTPYAKFVFLHSRKSALGHITLNFCFASGGTHGSRIALRCVRGVKRRCTIFLARVGPGQILENVHRDTFYQTCVFASGGICGSRSAFWYVRCVKY